jgi:hypothetical protein
MFQLSWEEVESLRSQIVTLNVKTIGVSKRGKHIKYLQPPRPRFDVN